MKALSDLNAGEKGKVKKIDAEGELKQLLFSLGLRKGSLLEVKAMSMAKSTMEIEVGTTLLALRFEEAKRIGIETL